MRKFKALLLAGGKNKHILKKVTGHEYKALITFHSLHSQPIIHYMVKILQNTQYLSQIYITGPEEVHKKIDHSLNTFIPSGRSLMDTLQQSMPYFKHESLILISTCDLPLVSNEHIEHFLEDCLKNPGFDIYYAIVEKNRYIQSFPSHNLRRVYANLIEGSFTGGNIFLINPKVITECTETIEKFILFRKHPLKMAQLLGKRIVIKYLKKYLSIRDLEKLVPELLKGYTGKAILADPEIALDIDKPTQLEALETTFKTS